MKKVKKDSKRFVGAGVGLGIGTAVIAKTGHGAAVLPAFATTGRMMRPVGTAMMGGHALRMLRKYNKKKRR